MRFWIATGFGSGLVPVAPGTAGSAVALLLFWLLTLPGIVAGSSPATLPAGL